MESAEWSEPDEQGNQTCPRHPGVAPFKASTGGCVSCSSDPADRDARPPGPGEKLCAAAAAMGLMNGLAVELLITQAWRRNEARADKCIARAEKLFESEDPDDIDRAIKLEGAAAKWADTGAKGGGRVAVSVSLREELASEERTARDLLRAKGEAG